MTLRALLVVLLFTMTARGETIRVAAAISLKEAITRASHQYEQATGERVEFSFGSSGQLMAQIRNGAKVDVFVSAGTSQMDALQEQALIDPATRRVIAANRLVLVAPADAKDPPEGFDELASEKVRRLAVGEPRTVPAGEYAQQVFVSLGIAEKLSGRIVYGANVRQVLAYVERGEVSAGVVYATDVKQAGDRVRVIATADPRLHRPIVYPVAAVAASQKQAAARRFLDYLAEADAQAVLQDEGFAAAAAPTTQPASP